MRGLGLIGPALLVLALSACAGPDRGGDRQHGGYEHEYRVTLDGFVPREADEVEGLMVNRFSGYRGLRLVESEEHRRAYLYDTTADTAALDRNLRHALSWLNFVGEVQASGDRFVVTKIGLSKEHSAPVDDRW